MKRIFIEITRTNNKIDYYRFESDIEGDAFVRANEFLNQQKNTVTYKSSKMIEYPSFKEIMDYDLIED